MSSPHAPLTLRPAPRARGRFATLTLLFAASWLACLWLVDGPLGEWCLDKQEPKFLQEFLEAAEHFGTPFGQLMILAVLLTVSRGRDGRVGRIWWGTVAAGLMANVLKLLVARTRPHVFPFDDPAAISSFTGWLPFGSGGSAMQSFPSAHTASAFAFATLLIWAWPTGRWAFLTIAACTAAQRVVISAHFPSDVLMGAMVGIFIASAFCNWSPIARHFTRWESLWQTRFGKRSAAVDDSTQRAAG